MIINFRHKGLMRLFEDDDRRGVNAEHVEKLRTILAMLDNAESVKDMDMPQFRLHLLTKDLKGYWSVTVRQLARHFPI